MQGRGPKIMIIRGSNLIVTLVLAAAAALIVWVVTSVRGVSEGGGDRTAKSKLDVTELRSGQGRVVEYAEQANAVDVYQPKRSEAAAEPATSCALLYQYFDDPPLPNGRFRDGRHTFTYPSGHIHSEEIWINGNREGRSVYYDDKSGNVIAEGRYSAGLQDGEWSYYFENGVIYAKGGYRENRKSGYCVFLMPDGTIDAEKTGCYRADAKIQ